MRKVPRRTRLRVVPDVETATRIGGDDPQLVAILKEVRKMSEVADNLRREIAETKEAVAATNAKVAEVLSFVDALKARLNEAQAIGLTAEEVAAMAADLDTAQASLSASQNNITTAVGDGTVPTPPTGGTGGGAGDPPEAT